MKKLFFALQYVLVGAIIISLLLAAQEFTGPGVLAKLNAPQLSFNHIEDYDPSLKRLDNVVKLENYCDSIYAEKRETGSQGRPVAIDSLYPQVVSEAVQKRFYHSYSYYGFGDNYVALAMNSFLIKSNLQLNAIVVTDDMMKYPFAACSQQSMVMMEVLGKKGFTTRKIGFTDNKYNYGGHFCLEVWYGNKWHFFDPNMEPDAKLLVSNGRPDVKSLAADVPFLVKAYSKSDPEKVKAFFSNYYYGEPNKFPAPKAVIYQHITKFLSYTLWIFFLILFVFVRKKYLRLSNNKYVRNRRVSIPHLHQRRPSEDYPLYGASGS